MSNYQYSSDLIEDALFRSGEPTGGSSDYESAALRYLNRAYQALIEGGMEFLPEMREDWWWLKAESNLILDPVITAGTVSVVRNSATANFSIAPLPVRDPNVTGWFFKTHDTPDVYRVASITGISATLDSVYTGNTNTTAAYTLFKLDYDIASDAMQLISPMRGYQNGRNGIQGVSLPELENETPLNLVQVGIPSKFAPVDENTVRFNAAPDDLVRIDYDYLKRPSDLSGGVSEEPLIPRQYRRVLSLMTAFWILQDKDDDRRVEVASEIKGLLLAMSKENRSRWARQGYAGRIFTRNQRRSVGPLRTESGSIIGW